jgi:hypothetical protein
MLTPLSKITRMAKCVGDSVETVVPDDNLTSAALAANTVTISTAADTTVKATITQVIGR